jgi:mxaK protein
LGVTRRRVHVLFGAVALAFGVAAAWQASRLDQADHVNHAIAVSADAATLESSVPEARFARAAMLAKTDNFDEASKAYKAAIQEDRSDLKRAALYNLGNLHMREAAKLVGTSSALPFVELAKQNYRDLLREDPEDWDARYNLERALWISPELDQEADDENANAPEFVRRVAPQSKGFRVDLP